MTPPSGEHPSRTSRLPLTSTSTPSRRHLDATKPPPVLRRVTLICTPLSLGLPNHTSHPPHRISRPRHTLRGKAAPSPRRSPSSARLPSTVLEVETRLEGVAQARQTPLPPQTASPSCALHPNSSVCHAARIAS
ncbi:hypothetical protein K523DRAFT_322668 [Schizophyllum commune Tattone D]|nr:hypothetical protein K523DRAFT_322668 [Schizophyllum commune Tattone D]